MKLHKKLLLGLSTCIVGLVSIVSLSSCSYFVYLLDSTSGEGSVTGTYSFDISVYDSNYTNYILNASSTVLDLFVGKGVTQTNTLVLGSDGTYTYTKELYFSTEGDSWYTYNLAVFYGNYTNSSNTVTLGEVTKIAYQFIPASIITSNGVNLPESEYTETTDLTATSYFLMSSFSVIDLWYGPYFAPTGYGNVSQTVYIGSYDWGGFTFADDGLSSLGGSTDDDDEESSKDYDTAFTLESGSSVYYLYLFNDYTFEFSVSYMGYNITEEGTWSYENGSLNISYGSDITQTSTSNGDDTISLYYEHSSYGSTISTTFTISVDEFETWYNKYVLSFYLESSSGMFWAYLYIEGTFDIEMSYSGYSISESGTWTYESSTLTLSNGTSSYNSQTTDDTLSISYVFASYSAANTTLECSATEFETWYTTYVSTES